MTADFPYKLANQVYTGPMAKAQPFDTLNVGDLFTTPGNTRVLMRVAIAGDRAFALDLTSGRVFSMLTNRPNATVIRLPDGMTVHIDQGAQVHEFGSERHQ